MSITNNLLDLSKSIPEGIKLVAVSKTKPKESIIEAYKAGHRIFGENRPQELKQKYEDLPKDIEWHFIGHLQTNKIKYIAPFVSLIHGVDSLRLLAAINNEALKNNRIIDCLLQFHIAEEETKFGLNLNEAKELLNSPEFNELKNVNLCGIMGMATFTDDCDKIRREFRNLKKIFIDLKENFFASSVKFKEVSMGMSGDYKIAMEEGSTIIRIGSMIFGSRH